MSIVNIKMSKSDMMILDHVLTDFLYDRQHTKALITKDGIKRLLEIRWAMAMQCVPDICQLSDKEFATMQDEICQQLNITQ